jgi:hypothetical protein
MSDDGVSGGTMRVGKPLVLCCVLYVRVCIDNLATCEYRTCSHASQYQQSLGYSRLITLKIPSFPCRKPPLSTTGPQICTPVRRRSTSSRDPQSHAAAQPSARQKANS